MNFTIIFMTFAAFAADALQMETTAHSAHNRKHQKKEKVPLKNIVTVAASVGLGTAVTMEYFGRTGTVVSDSIDEVSASVSGTTQDISGQTPTPAPPTTTTAPPDPKTFILPEQFASDNGATVTEYDIDDKGDGVKDISFQLPFIQNGVVQRNYERRFQIKVPGNAKRLVIQNHAYYVFGFADQNSYTRLNDNAENLDAVVVTTLGSDDLNDGSWNGLSSLPGWNAWGCGVQVEPTPNNQGDQCTIGNSPNATCLDDRGEYPCYETQLLFNGGSCGPVKGVADSSLSCTSMSAQDDVQYLRQVILFLKSYQNFQWLDFPVTSLGQSQGGIFTGDVYHSLTTFTYNSETYEYIDGAVVVSAASLRNYLPKGQSSNRPVLNLRGYQDTVVPPCITQSFVENLGFDTTTYPYENGANERALANCNDNFDDAVCISSDDYLYSSLNATLASFAGRTTSLNLEEDITWGGIINPSVWGLDSTPSDADDLNGSFLNCGNVTAKSNVQVCIYNYGHDFPFQKSDREFVQGDDGVQAWIKLLNNFLETVSI